MVSHTAYAELDFAALLEQLSHERARGPEELMGKLVVLDANVELGGHIELQAKIAQVVRQIGKGRVWAVEVVDSFSLASSMVKYTLRVSYQGMDDAEAKSLHEKIFSIL
jgi:phenylalanyl-tRNA synthetase beta subunit